MSKIHGSELAAIASGARRKVEVLSRSFPSRSGLFPERLSQAADYIEQELVSLGHEKIKRQHFEVQGRRYSNLVVELEGKNPRRASSIIIGAHYDTVVGTPGADDNASGVAGLLELARLFR
ncbi:MAG: M28 family peptidase, partial [Bacteroidota bacterium]